MKKRKIQNIHDRIYNFVIKVLKFVKKIPKTPENLIIIKQIVKSATSMGANDREADAAITKKDFIHKYGIVRKEGNETDYWLNVVADTVPKLFKEGKSLSKECQEILKIVSTIIFKTRKKKQKH